MDCFVAKARSKGLLSYIRFLHLSAWLHGLTMSNKSMA